MKKQFKNKKMLSAFKILLFVSVVWGLFFTGACSSESKVYKIGILSGMSIFEGTVESFVEKMNELGYTENENIVYDIQKTEVDMAAYEKTLKQFVADKVDLIFVFPTEATVIAKQVTQGTEIPVVFAHVVIEGADVIDSILEPGGNITGVRFPAPEISLRRFDILVKTVTNLKRIFVPYLKDYPSVPYQSEKLAEAAQAAGVTIEGKAFSSPDEFVAFLDQRTKQGNIAMDAVLDYAEPISGIPAFQEPLLNFAARFKIPVANIYLKFGEASTVFAVIYDFAETGVQGAILSDKILKGTPAGTIPVITPENKLTIDYQMAQKIGLDIPEGILQQADKIIK